MPKDDADTHKLLEAVKPIYTWPHPKFPFRHFFDSKDLKIFIIENIPHNYSWLSKYRERIDSRHFFFVYCGWFHSPVFALNSQEIFSALQLNKDNFYFLFNSEVEKQHFSERGFLGDVINQNCWLDENIIVPFEEAQKKFDGIMVARKAAFKRHYLAAKVKNLALVSSGPSYVTEDLSNSMPTAAFESTRPLSAADVCRKISESRCGLILSAEEGACFASSEYLLCGIPVVSTPSVGGRDVWYDDYNSIICEPNEDSVLAALQTLLESPRDPLRIRAAHIEKSRFYRARFVRVLQEVFDRCSLDINAENYFKSHFLHKMRESVEPNFDAIF